MGSLPLLRNPIPLLRNPNPREQSPCPVCSYGKRLINTNSLFPQSRSTRGVSVRVHRCACTCSLSWVKEILGCLPICSVQRPALGSGFAALSVNSSSGRLLEVPVLLGRSRAQTLIVQTCGAIGTWGVVEEQGGSSAGACSRG